MHGKERTVLIINLGAYKERTGGSECHNSYSRWEVGDGDMAGNLVLGVQGEQTSAQSCSYDSGGENFIARSRVVGYICLLKMIESYPIVYLRNALLCSRN